MYKNTDLDGFLNFSELPHNAISEINKFLENNEWENIPNGLTHINSTLKVVKIIGEQPTEFKDLLEYHKHWIDIHYTHKGIDKFCLTPLAECENEHKSYSESEDYGLYSDPSKQTLELGPKHFLILDIDCAHMAMCGQGKIEKLVFKVKR